MEVTNSKKDYSVSKVYVAACGGIAIFGVVMLALGSVMPTLTTKIPAAISLPQYMSIGIILGTLVFGPIVDKFGYKWLLIAASALSLLGLGGLAILNNILSLRFSIIILGFGGGILNGETSALVSDIFVDNRKKGAKMSLMSAFYCIGALLWTLSCTIVTNYKIPLAVALIIIFAFIIYFISIEFPKAKQQEDISYIDSAKLLRYPVLILFSAVLFFQSGFEGITGFYSSQFLVSNGIALNAATFALTMYTVGMLIGRLALGLIIGKTKDSNILSIYLLIALAGTIAMKLSNLGLILPFAGMFLIGFGAGATFPVILSYIGTVFSSRTGSAFSAAMFIALCGNYTLNHITGKAFASGNSHLLPVFMICAVLAMLIILPIAVKIAKNFKFNKN